MFKFLNIIQTEMKKRFQILVRGENRLKFVSSLSFSLPHYIVI